MEDLHNKDTAMDFYDARYEEGYMEEWDELKKSKVREVLLQLGLPQKGNALDFGCGNGVFTRIIKDVLPQWEVYGVEISKIAIANARKKHKDCIFFEADQMEQYKGKFDFLFSHHVIEHVQNLKDTFETINLYLQLHSVQLHILPCGNEGSYEYEISRLKINGIEKDKDNRFFFEEPGHLRRLTTAEFVSFENKIGFTLKNEFYSNQHLGAINWITKNSPRFVKRLTKTDDVVDENALKKISKLRKKLLPLTYSQFPYTKYIEIKNKSQKRLFDYLKLAIVFFPAIIAKPVYEKWQKKAQEEWDTRKNEKNGSEMFLCFIR